MVALFLALSVLPGQGRPAIAGEPVLRVECSATLPTVGALSWDTEGGGRAETNLLRTSQPLGLQVQVGGQWKSGIEFPTEREVLGPETRYHLSLADNADLYWSVTPANGGLTMSLSVEGSAASSVQGLKLVFPFDPGATPTTVLPSQWADDGSLRLPAVINSPDFGQMLLTEVSGSHLTARLEGSRSNKTVDFIVNVPVLQPGKACSLSMTPLRLSPPAGLQNTVLWEKARRGWFGAFQPSAKWGDQGNAYSAPAGILANNVISDPASMSLWYYADQALFTPQVAPGISAMTSVRRSVNWWLDNRTNSSTGEVTGYWNIGNFLDANAGPLIAAWDYVKASGDTPWLQQRVGQLESVAEFLARRDVDGDGMVEAVQSGNRGTLQQPGRSCCWFDALNCGHKDGYSNAVIYRAWRCLADLEGQLGHTDKQARYTALADRLKAAYTKTLYNPATGWLAGWKSQDGELHDYASPVVNGIAIEYGLVEPAQGRGILAKLWAKINQVGFNRFDLGIPMTLDPVRRSDYLQSDAPGLPQKEDGTDTLGQYMNGGITAGQVLHFLAAHYVVGQPEKADEVLEAMLQRLAEGKFQNGVRDAAFQGIDWTDWNGNPTGYEGYLADNFQFLEAVLLREPAFRAEYYGPLGESIPEPSTFVLLGMGLLCLLAYGWWKRK